MKSTKIQDPYSCFTEIKIKVNKNSVNNTDNSVRINDVY